MEKILTIPGPIYSHMQLRNNEIEIFFKHTNGSLIAQGGELKGFTIAGADHIFYPAEQK